MKLPAVNLPEWLTRRRSLDPVLSMKIGVALMIVGMVMFYAGSFFLGRYSDISYWAIRSCMVGATAMFSGIGFFSWFMFKTGI